MKLKYICEKNHLTEVSIPKIGFGLDKLELNQVRAILRYIFRNSTIKIIAFCKDNLNEEKKLKIIAEHHNLPLAQHQGIERTFSHLQTTYLWKGMKQQVKDYIRRCPTYQ